MTSDELLLLVHPAAKYRIGKCVSYGRMVVITRIAKNMLFHSNVSSSNSR